MFDDPFSGILNAVVPLIQTLSYTKDLFCKIRKIEDRKVKRIKGNYSVNFKIKLTDSLSRFIEKSIYIPGD